MYVWGRGSHGPRSPRATPTFAYPPLPLPSTAANAAATAALRPPWGARLGTCHPPKRPSAQSGVWPVSRKPLLPRMSPLGLGLLPSLPFCISCRIGCPAQGEGRGWAVGSGRGTAGKVWRRRAVEVLRGRLI